MPLAKTGGQSPCRFGDNLERTGYGVKMQVRLLELIERQSIREARFAARMLSRISIKASCALLESINGFTLGVGPDKRFQSLAIRHVDRHGKQLFDILDDARVVEKAYVGVRIDLNHNVDIAVGTLLAPRPRTKQGGMSYPALAQGAFVFS